MAREVNRLTEAKVKSRKLAKGLYHDGGGLYLQVGLNGSKSWIYRYKRKRPGEAKSKARDMGLGPYPAVSLAGAREKRDVASKLHQSGKDPLEEKAAEELQAQLAAVRGESFKQAAEAYIDAHEDGWRNAKHRQQWRNTLATYAYPVIGHLAVAEIAVADVRAVIEPIWKTKPETASRVRGRVETIINAARADDDSAWSNPANWERHKHKLVSRPEPRHQPALPWKKVPAFMARLRKFKGVTARCLEYTILTAVRTSEATGARFPEADVDDAVWKIPGARMKNRKPFTVPLSPGAVEIIKAQAAVRISDYMFPGLKEGMPLSNMAMLELLRGFDLSDDDGNPITVHGFRSSFRDWAGENGWPHDVCEMALAHTRGDKVHAAYQRGELLEKRRELMNAWALYCLPAPKNAKRMKHPPANVKSPQKERIPAAQPIQEPILVG